MRPTTTVEYGLYIHVPFCTTKCGYCDFYSIPDAGRDTRGLVARLIVELESRLGDCGESIGTVFVGGGTPTVLDVGALEELVGAVASQVRESTCREFTVEANPATLDAAKADVLRRGGVNRLSLGAQSFHPADLAALERIHEPGDIAPAIKVARQAGFESVNLDLIFGIPGQTLDRWIESIERAVDLEPDHLALYGLTYEPGTMLTRRRELGRVQPCNEGLEADMYLAAIEVAGRNGFGQYEISNFAKPGHRCLHNLMYWNNRPYVAVGPSAVGYVDGVRYRNVPDAGRYVRSIDERGDAVIETERLEGPAVAAETAMVLLRLVAGIDRAEFGRRFGIDVMKACCEVIERFETQGLLVITPTHLALSDRGRLFADTVIAEVMAALGDARPEGRGLSLPVMPG